VILKGFTGKQKKARKLMKETVVIVNNISTKQRRHTLRTKKNYAILGIDWCRICRVHFVWKRIDVAISNESEIWTLTTVYKDITERDEEL
jgi:hypothetical protein